MGKTGKFRLSGGFTLIEMLVVIVIIVILMGVVFRLSRAALAKGNDAKETARVAIFKALVEEFHAEYGIYPPVPEYSDEKKKITGRNTDTGNLLYQPISFTGPVPKNSNDLDDYVKFYAFEDGTERRPFAFGLLSFFVSRPTFGKRTFSREGGGRDTPNVRASWEGYNDKIPATGEISQSSKDKAFVKRVKPILEQFEKQDANQTRLYLDGNVYTSYDEQGRTMGFNAFVHDSWGRDYIYISEPPYTSYLIFSKGADGKYDPDAPADKTKAENKDNIYAGMEDN